jgi:hypothetical protein
VGGDPRYAIRPAKDVERQMIVEACRRLRHISPTERYSYIGMGALEFVDFKLFHRALGIHAMVSIESENPASRYEFNRPYKTIEIAHGKASHHLPLLDWVGLKIVWLDYEGQLLLEFVRDAQTVVNKAEIGSLLIVTLNAHAQYGGRMQALATNLQGEALLPLGLVEESLDGWGFAKAQRQILLAELNRTATARGIRLEQVFNFVYQDGAKMQTVGWLLSSAALDGAVSRCDFKSLPFIRTGDEAFHLKVPLLTGPEADFLDRKLPGRRPKVAWLKPSVVEEYSAIYPYYPRYTASSR